MSAPERSADTGLRIGTAPDSWGVWFADHPRQVPWQRFLDEAAAAGYHYLELGPFGYLPTDPSRLADELAARDLQLCAGTVFTGLHRDGEWESMWEKVSRVAELVHAVGAADLVVLPDTWRSELTGEQIAPRDLDDDEWARLVAGHDRLGRALLEEYGIAQRFHSHADTHVGTAEQVRKLLQQTDSTYLSLCLDTAHYAYYGGDCLALIDEYPDRIGYLHLKQLDPAVRAEMLAADTPFAHRAGELMVTPPGGIPDLVPIIDAVAKIAPGAFGIVEQDMPGCAADRPLAIATETRRYLQGCHPITRTR